MSDSSTERSSEDIRRDIERTRANLDETVDALEGRISPGQLLDKAWSMFRQEGSGAGDVVRDHPVPLALMGLGVAWLAIERATSSGRGDTHEVQRDRGTSGWDDRAEGRAGTYSESPRDQSGQPAPDASGLIDRTRETIFSFADKAADAKDRISEKLSDVGDDVSEATRRTGQTAEQTLGQVKERAREARHGIAQFIDNSPLVAGGISFGLGLAAGFATPGTRWENRAVGETAETIKETVGEAAREVGEQVKHVAYEAVDAAREEADRQSLGRDLRSSIKHVAEEAKMAARETARDEDLSVESVQTRARETVDRVKERTRKPKS